MAREQRREAPPVRITTAASSKAADIAARQKRYLFSMSLRSLCFIGAVISGIAGVNWLWPILIAGALILPYIAVVMANATMQRSQETDLLDTAYQRELSNGRG